MAEKKQYVLAVPNFSEGRDQAKVDKIVGAIRDIPGLKLVIAPRHFEKADAVEANIKAAGFECVRRSRSGESAASPR